MSINRYPELWKIVRKNIGLFSLILIPNLIAALFEGISFALIFAALAVLTGETSPIDLPFFALLIAAIGFQAIRSAIGGIAIYANSVLSLRIQEAAQIQIYQNIFALSYPDFNQYKIGDLGEYVKTPAAVINVIMDNANKCVIALFMILAILCTMCVLDFKLTLLTLLLLAGTGAIHKWLIQKIARSSENMTRHGVDCSKYTMQVLQSMRTIHTYNRQEYAFGIIRKSLDSLIAQSKSVYFWSNFIPSINELIGTSLVAAILFAAEGTLPALITFIALTHRLAIRIQNGNGALGLIFTHQGSIRRLEEILSKTSSAQTGDRFLQFSDCIEFDRVSLPTRLDRISLKIPKGKTIAFVGASGAGKSSLFDLLLKLYEPTQGAIRIDGVDLKRYSAASWRETLGVVSQEFSIFHDTIEENIRFGHPGNPDISQAARLAGLDVGLQTVVGERGFRLSGGQKQRLCLARALLRNPEILILDEATSSLDSESEASIQNALETLKGRTILIAAHRLSTIRHADWIYVLDRGRIAEEGTHDHLLEKQGTYAKFWTLQASPHLVRTQTSDGACL